MAAGTRILSGLTVTRLAQSQAATDLILTHSLKMRVKLAQELWIIDGELAIPWLRFQDGTGARGLVTPPPLVLEKGKEIDIDLPAVRGREE